MHRETIQNSGQKRFRFNSPPNPGQKRFRFRFNNVEPTLHIDPPKQPEGLPAASQSNINGGNSSICANTTTDLHFPDRRLRVMLIDHHRSMLLNLQRLLTKCSYQVTACINKQDALSILRERKNDYDVVISDVHMPDLDGLKLLKHVFQEMDLPVIMMSEDESESAVMQSIAHGACDYLVKPISLGILKNIWQHVVRKRMTKCYCYKRREVEQQFDSAKPPFYWTSEMDKKFDCAVNQLGIEKAMPEEIFDLMNAPGIATIHVTNRLQEYRQKWQHEFFQQQVNLDNFSLNHQGLSYEPSSSFTLAEIQNCTVGQHLVNLKYGSLLLQNTPTLSREEQVDKSAELQSGSYHLPDNPIGGEFSENASLGMEDPASLGMEDPAGFVPSYDIFNMLNHHSTTYDWEL